MITVVIVAAVAKNQVIGKKGKLPWNIPFDLKVFRRHTIGKPVIMGSKTFDSIGAPLNERINIVVSRKRDFFHPAVVPAKSFEEGLQLGMDFARSGGVDEVAVIGGGELYTQAMPLAHKIELTEVCLEIEGDILFPYIDPAQWLEIARRSFELSGGIRISLVTYKRIW